MSYTIIINPASFDLNVSPNEVKLEIQKGTSEVNLKVNNLIYDFAYDKIVYDVDLARVGAQGTQGEGATLEEIGAITKDMTGVENRTDSSLLFDDASRTFTWNIDSSAKVYLLGKGYNVTSSKTIEITNLDGGRYIMYNPELESLYELSVGAFPNFQGEILISYIYWDSVNQEAIIVGDERHSSARDTTFQLYEHLAEGMRWFSGGTLSYTLEDDDFPNFEVVNSTRVADEDLQHIIVHSETPSSDYEQKLQGTTDIPVVHYIGNSRYAQIDMSAESAQWPHAPSGLVYYNDINSVSDTGVLVESGNGGYVCYYLVATNDIRHPLKLLMGQASHINLNDARSEKWVTYGLPTPEIVALYRFIIKTANSYNNTSKARIEEVYTLGEGPSLAGTSTISGLEHNSLTGRTQPNAHSISSITDLSSILDQKITIVSEPLSSTGVPGDLKGLFAINNTHLYVCTADYDGVTNIWKRIEFLPDTW